MFNIQNQEQENNEFSRYVIIPAFPSRAELKFDGNTTTIMRTFLLHIFTYDWARGVWARNSSPSKSIKCTQFEVVLGRKQNLPIDNC